ncbi:MAG: hypothetical protein WD649_02925 [Thermoleophilaceae bacterium]
MSSPSKESRPLACPSCALRYPLDERFCADCRMPLVYAGAEQVEARSEKHERARKINPSYTSGELVRVAGARNQAEAELIQGLLIEEGVPSMLRRTRGFDVPDFLAAGPRDVMVPESGAGAAREILSATGATLPPQEGSEAPRPRPARVLIAVFAGGALATLIAWGLIRVAG